MSLEPTIYQLIPKVMAEIGAVSKDRKNEQQKYSFRGIEDFYKAAHPALIAHGVFCVPEVTEHAVETFTKTNDFGKSTTWRHVTIKVRHRFYGPAGDYVDVVTMGEGLDNSDKATNKAMSGAMKYALIELFSVPTEDVDDADRTTPEAGTKRKTVATTTEAIPIQRPSAASGNVKGTAAEPSKTATAAPEAVEPREPGSDDEELIDLPRQRALHREFRDAIRNEEARKNADKFLQDWLKHAGYIGADAKGTTKTIPMTLFAEVKSNAVRYAMEMPA